MSDIISLQIQGDLPSQFAQAFKELGPRLQFVLAEDGVVVEVKQGGQGLRVEKTPLGVSVQWQKPVHLYRSLSILRQEWAQEAFINEETPCFETLGMMLDVSRNAVLKVSSVKAMLQKMALMGMNLGMMYTEDTYEIPEQPYFGWMRGKYSIEELRELDDYADMLGIELCPCIQTLGHLNRALHWPALAHLKDNEEVILEGEEATYAFLKQAITAAMAPYRSKRIHIGMDEAHGIGMGAHLRRFGYESPHVIIRRHLSRVKQITDSLGLSPMMWSDMYFRPDSPTGGYYDSGEPTAESIASVLDDVMLLYWDYYHEDKEKYADMLRKHTLLGASVGFTGGIWTWAGPAPAYDKTINAVVPGLQAAKEAGVQFVLATAWNDNGAEANLQTALLGMQIFAEFNYTGDYNRAQVQNRFKTCCGADALFFEDLSLFNKVPGMKSGSLRPVNAAKFLLYQDPLVQIYEKDTYGLPMAKHYSMLAEKYVAYKQDMADEYASLSEFYVKLARVLAGKCRWHEEIGPAVRTGNKKAASELALFIKEVEAQAQELREIWCRLWNETNKPFGFEILDGRMGAVCARLSTASARVLQWSNGDANAPAELLEPELPYTQMADGALFGSYAVGEIVSACKIDI